jgi:hypothetical protein
MKLLVETIHEPSGETSQEIEAGLIIGGNGSHGELFAAEEAIVRVLEGREQRAAFSDEERICLQGLETALENGQYDTSGKGLMQVIPPKEGDLLIGAMRLFAGIPEEEKTRLSDSEIQRWDSAILALQGLNRVHLEPGTTVDEAVQKIAPDFVEPKAPPTSGGEYDFEWLYTPSDVKVNGNTPQPIRYATTTDMIDAATGRQLFKEKLPEDVASGVSVFQLETQEWSHGLISKDADSAEAHELVSH